MTQSRRDFLSGRPAPRSSAAAAQASRPAARPREPATRRPDGVRATTARSSASSWTAATTRTTWSSRPTRRTTTSTPPRGRRSRLQIPAGRPSLAPDRHARRASAAGGPSASTRTCRSSPASTTQNKLARRHQRRPARRADDAGRYIDDTKPKPYALFSHSDQIDCWQTGPRRHQDRDRLGRPRRRRRRRLQRAARASRRHVDLRLLDLLHRPRTAAALDRHRLADEVLVLNGFNGSPRRTSRARTRWTSPRTIDSTATLIAAASDDDPAGRRHQRGLLDVDPTITHRLPEHRPRQPAEAGRQGHQAEPDLAGLNLNRQIFFVAQGGYDTHQDQIDGPGQQLPRPLAGA